MATSSQDIPSDSISFACLWTLAPITSVTTAGVSLLSRIRAHVAFRLRIAILPVYLICALERFPAGFFSRRRLGEGLVYLCPQLVLREWLKEISVSAGILGGKDIRYAHAPGHEDKGGSLQLIIGADSP